MRRTALGMRLKAFVMYKKNSGSFLLFECLFYILEACLTILPFFSVSIIQVSDNLKQVMFKNTDVLFV